MSNNSELNSEESRDTATTEEVEIVEESEAKSISNQVVPLSDTQIKMSVISKIQEIDGLYKRGTLEYTESIHRYNIEIEKLKSQIEVENSKNAEEERALFAVENIIDYEVKLFESLHHKFTQKLESLVELRDEYKGSLEESIYNDKFSRKERELTMLLDEIEEKEISILNRELEKINLSTILGKKLKIVEELIRSLKEIELEKSYFESTELQKISYLNRNSHNAKDERPQLVETTIVNDAS